MAMDHVALAASDAGSTGKRNAVADRRLRMRLRISVVEMAIGGLDGQHAALRHRVAAVDAEVQDRVFELIGITNAIPKTRGEHCLHVQVRAHRPADQLFHAADQRVHVHERGLQCLPTGKGQ